MATRPCPHCGERIQNGATMCRFCRQSVPKVPEPHTGLLLGGAVVLALALAIGLYVAMQPPSFSPTTTTAVAPRSAPAADTAALQRAVDEQEAEADAAEALRAKHIRKHFPARSNAIEDCVAQKGGAQIPADFYFGSELSIAYKMQLGEPLAKRFIAYTRKASRCTAFSTSDLQRALLPALPHIQNTKQLGTLIALAGDICASKAENTPEALRATVQTLADVFGD